MRLIATFLFLSGAALAQTLAKPLAAILIDRDGELVAVHGFGGNLLPPLPVVPPRVSGSAFGASFNGVSGAVKIGGQIVVLNSDGSVKTRFPSPDGPALFSFQSDGALAWTYFANYALFQSAANSSAFSAGNLPGTILALGPGRPDMVSALALSGGQLWSEQIDTTGALVSQTPVSGTGPAIWFEGGWLVAADAGMLWHAPGASAPRKIATAEPVRTLQASGRHYASVNGRWLVDTKGEFTEIPSSRRFTRRMTAQP